MTITQGSTTHEEAAGGLTACGKKIGPPADGWRHYANTVGPMPVNCRACLVVRTQADSFLEFIDTVKKGEGPA